jgi:chemotaxis protein methyltransferase CheR
MNHLCDADQVTADELSRYADLIYKQTGIRISPQKRTLLSNRVRRRLKATGIADYGRYFAHLKSLPCTDPEWDAFLQEITTHETYLFRDPSVWDWFRSQFLPGVQAQAQAGARAKTLRIWSAAASTGDEAYTIACCIAERLGGFDGWRIEIVGSDIGVGALEQARAAEFGERAMRLVPPDLRRRFFTATENQHWKANPTLTRWVSFRQHNLLDPFKGTPFDAVFLRNVLIYFDTPSKKTALGHIAKSLRPDGLLVSGPAEGISDLITGYERLQPWLYRLL